jgi:hypothetical protein
VTGERPLTAFLDANPLYPAERVRALMEQHIPEATVEDYEVLVGQLALPDDGDRHVLAAAIKGDAEILVTANLKHFPAPALAPYGIEALHPDEFVLRLIERVPARVLAAARDHRQSLKNPPRSVDEYLAALEKLGLAGTVAAGDPVAASQGWSNLAEIHGWRTVAGDLRVCGRRENHTPMLVVSRSRRGDGCISARQGLIVRMSSWRDWMLSAAYPWATAR